MDISILILTLNEEENLERCLESVAWSNDIVVLDSFSNDNTKNIALNSKVRFIEREFDSYAGQRNFGLKEIEYLNQWVLMVDADEVVPSELVQEMKSMIAAASDDVCLYRMRRKDFLMGRWIKRSSGYPTWFGRLARLGRVWVERDINEEYHTDGKIKTLKGHLHHYPFNKGFHEWLEKHNRYSTMEAIHRVQEKESLSNRLKLKDFFSNDPQVRRVAVKKAYYSLPARPFVAFIGLFVFKMGMLEGRAGFTFSLLRSIYELMIDLKVKEIQRKADRLPL